MSIVDNFKALITADNDLSAAFEHRVYEDFNPVPAQANFNALRKYYPSIILHSRGEKRQRSGNGFKGDIKEDVQVEVRGLVNTADMISRNASERAKFAAQQQNLKELTAKLENLLDELTGTHGSNIIKTCLIDDKSSSRDDLKEAIKQNFAIDRRILIFKTFYRKSP